MFNTPMTRLLFLVLLCLPTLASAQHTSVPPVPTVAARAYVLLDYQTNQFIATNRAEERMEPASLTKLMSAYLVFEALKKGQIRMNQTVPISVKAWKSGGSRMFVEPDR